MNAGHVYLAGDLSLEINVAGAGIIWQGGKVAASTDCAIEAADTRATLRKLKKRHERVLFLESLIRKWNSLISSQAALPPAAIQPAAQCPPIAAPALPQNPKQIYARTPQAGLVELCLYGTSQGGLVVPLSRGQIINMHKVLGEAVRALAEKSTLPERDAL